MRKLTLHRHREWRPISPFEIHLRLKLLREQLPNLSDEKRKIFLVGFAAKGEKREGD
jgi:hypothetical protein